MKIEFLNGEEAGRLAAQHVGNGQDEPAVACGAALAGARVVGVANGHGLRAALEQLPVQAGMRLPMVLNVACEQAELQPALNSGWLIFCARDAQAVYDLTLAAVKVGEHPEVRLPALVVYDSRMTRREKRRVQVLDGPAAAGFLGSAPARPSPLDAEHPGTFGARLASDVELSQAMQAARRVIPGVLAELARLTGRSYPLVEAHGTQGEEALVALNAAGETGGVASVLSPNVLRPFPAEEFRERLRTVKRVTVVDRSGILAIELRSALHGDLRNQTEVIEAVAAATDKAVAEPGPGLPPIPAQALAGGMAKVRRNEATGRLEVELEPLWKMTAVPGRLAPGHGACPGCGAFATLHQIYNVLEGELVVLVQSGCAAEVSVADASTAHRINVVHYPRANGAAVLSGLVAASRSKDTTFLMISGDGAMQEGLASAVAAACRNVRMMVLEYDNHGRMSEGEPAPASALGRAAPTADIFAACGLPYVFTACEGHPEDLMRKVAKAQWYVKNEGMVYGKVLSYCPLHWRAPDDAAQAVLQAAIDSCFFPLYEMERGHTFITYDPEATDRRKPVAEWLKLMGRTADLPGEEVARIQAQADRRWARLKAMAEHPLL
jgi:pyruvate ferredoxin oxidoreductase alpha subunit